MGGSREWSSSSVGVRLLLEVERQKCVVYAKCIP